MGEGEKEKISTILEASRKRFGHYGLAKTTMSEIASDIGMSKAALYYYFPDKEHLFVAVICREMDGFIAEMEKVVSASHTATEKIGHYVKKRFQYFQEFLNLSKISGASIEHLKPALVKVNAEFGLKERKIIREILQSGITSGEFDVLDVTVHADLFVSALHGFRTLIIKQRDSFLLTTEDYDQLSNYQSLFTQIFVKGITKNSKK